MPQDPDIERILLTGVVALMSAVVGGLIVAMVNAWNQRRLTRDTELRKWRLEQLRPTLERANRALARFEELDEIYHRLNREGGDEARAAFVRHVRWEANPFSNLSHSIVMARVGTDKIQDSLNRLFVSYNACMEDVIVGMSRSLITGDDSRFVTKPSMENYIALIDSIRILNQAAERYAFGQVGPPTLEELREERDKLAGRIERLTGTRPPDRPAVGKVLPDEQDRPS